MFNHRNIFKILSYESYIVVLVFNDKKNLCSFCSSYTLQRPREGMKNFPGADITRKIERWKWASWSYYFPFQGCLYICYFAKNPWYDQLLIQKPEKEFILTVILYFSKVCLLFVHLWVNLLLSLLLLLSGKANTVVKIWDEHFPLEW